MDTNTYTKNLGDFPNWTGSANVTVTITSADLTSRVATAAHANGSKTFTWDSTKGGLQ